MLSWVAGGAMTTAGVLVLLGDGDAPRRASTVALPPMREIVLVEAVRKSHCRLERVRSGSALRAPSAQPRPAPPRIYDAPPAVPALAAATRRGIIVIRYDPRTPAGRLEELRQLQRVIPQGTILAPGEPARRDALVVASYRRVLRCPEVSDSSLNALRLFRGRFIGSGSGR